MAERRETLFQNNVLLTCTGKVAGLLDHRLMVQPPGLAQDYVFIIVPDAWAFHDKGLSVSASPAPSSAAVASAVGSSSFGRTPFQEIKAGFASCTSATPPTPLATATPTPASTPTPSTQHRSLSTSPTPAPAPKRSAPGVDHTLSAKRSHSRLAPSSPIVIPSSESPSIGSWSSQETIDEPQAGCGGNQPPIASFMRHIAPATHPPVIAPAPAPILDTITASVSSEFSNRPHRSRNPPKK